VPVPGEVLSAITGLPGRSAGIELRRPYDSHVRVLHFRCRGWAEVMTSGARKRGLRLSYRLRRRLPRIAGRYAYLRSCPGRICRSDLPRYPAADDGRVEVDRLPAEVQQLAATPSGIGRETVEGVQPVRLCGGLESIQLPGGRDTDWLLATVTWAFGSFGRIGGKQLLDVYGVSESFAQGAVDVGDCPCRQRAAIMAAVLAQVAVELRYHGRAQGLQPHPPDAGHDVVIDVVAVSGQRFRLHGRGVGIYAFGQIVSHGQR
jgi:hypothetical protein